MILIHGAKVYDPRHAEGVVTTIWQLSSGRDPVGLYLLGMGEPGKHVLGISSPNWNLARHAADMVARDTGGTLENGTLVPQAILADTQVAAYHVVPSFRDFKVSLQAAGWPRTDSLVTMYNSLGAVPHGLTAGVAIVFRMLPGTKAATSITAFAAGPGCNDLAYGIAASYAWVGVKIVRPLRQRRQLQRALSAQIPIALGFFRQDCVLHADQLAAFWHPQIQLGENR